MPVQNLLIRSGANFDIKEIAAKMQRTQPLMSEAFGKYFKTAEVQQQFSERMAKMREQFKDPSADKWWFHGRAELPATSGKMFEGLLQRGYDPNTIGLDGLTVFQNIARTGTVEAIELFIAHGADINRLTPDGRAPLVLAIRAGNNLVTDALRAHGASDAGLRPIDELIGACLRVDVPEARAIVKSHPNATDDMSPEDFEPFVRAAAADILPQLRLMAESGFNLGGMGEAGITALHAAAWHGHLESIRLLLEFHAPVNVRDTTYGSSPLAWAAHGSRNCRSADDAYCAIVTALLEAGADYESAVSRAGVRPESIASARVAALLSPKDGIDNAVEP
jgi:ankyrin repeat protein